MSERGTGASEGDLAKAEDGASRRARIIEAAKTQFIRSKCKQPDSGVALVAAVLFDAAKEPDGTAAQRGIARDALLVLIEKRAHAISPDRFYGREDIDRDITRLGQRVSEARGLLAKAGIARIAGPTGKLRGDDLDLLWLDIELRDPAPTGAEDAHPVGVIAGFLRDRYEQLSPERQAAVARRVRRGLPGIVRALIILLGGCALLYYVRTSQVTTTAVMIRTRQDPVVTILRWKTGTGVRPPFEILRDGKVIATTSADSYIDREPGTNSVYRVAARWRGLARATSAATLSYSYVEHMQPCVALDHEGNGLEALCVPSFAEPAFLQERLDEFAAPLDAAAFLGMRVEHWIVAPPDEPEGARLDLARDVLRIKKGDGSSFAPGTKIAEKISYHEPGRFRLAVNAPSGATFQTDRHIRVFDSSEFPKLAITRDTLSPTLILSDGRLLAARPAFVSRDVSAAVIDRPDLRALDVAVRLPASSPYIPIVWDGRHGSSRQLEMTPVAGVSPPLYVARVLTTQGGPTRFQILGRRFVFDRTLLGSVTANLAERQPIPDDPSLPPPLNLGGKRP